MRQATYKEIYVVSVETSTMKLIRLCSSADDLYNYIVYGLFVNNVTVLGSLWVIGFRGGVCRNREAAFYTGLTLSGIVLDLLPHKLTQPKV